MLQLTFASLPSSIGGTEIYVSALASNLRKAGVESEIVVPSTQLHLDEVDGVPVRYLTSQGFSDELSQRRADIVHCHPLVAGDLLPWIRIARSQGCGVLCTYHTPTLTCGRGDLLLHGEEPCDGRLDVSRCALCVVESKGLPGPLAKAVVGVPAGPSRALAKRIPGKGGTAFEIRAQRERALEDWIELRSLVHEWVAVSRWGAEVLKINGVAAAAITVSRQGIADDTPAPSRNKLRCRGPRVIVGYLGRIHPHKGIETLLRSIERIAAPAIEVRIAGTGPPQYLDMLRRLCPDDPRVRWMGAIQPGEVQAFLGELDVLVVPSIWLETGPMTVLEAWAAGVSILGSDRGGIAEWVDEFGGGVLYPAGDHEALAARLQALVDGDITIPVVPSAVRSMSQVASEMIALYSKVGMRNGAHDTYGN